MVMKRTLNEKLLEKVAGGLELQQFYCRGEAVLYDGDDYEVIKAKFSFIHGWLYDIKPYEWTSDVKAIRYNVPQNDLVGDSD